MVAEVVLQWRENVKGLDHISACSECLGEKLKHLDCGVCEGKKNEVLLWFRGGHTRHHLGLQQEDVDDVDHRPSASRWSCGHKALQIPSSNSSTPAAFNALSQHPTLHLQLSSIRFSPCRSKVWSPLNLRYSVFFMLSVYHGLPQFLEFPLQLLSSGAACTRLLANSMHQREYSLMLWQRHT